MRNTFENVSKHYRNVPEFYELFRITFENILTDFLKTILTFRNNVPKHLWQWNIIEIFRNSFENNAEYFLNCSGTHFEMSRNTFENHLNVSEQCSEHFFELFRNTFEKHSGTLWKIFQNIFENCLNISKQCSKTLVTMFRNTIEMFQNTFENIAKHF